MDLREKACFDMSDFLFGGVLMRCFLVGFIYNNGVYGWCILGYCLSFCIGSSVD